MKRLITVLFLAVAVASAPALATTPPLHVTLKVASGTNVTLVTDTDSSGLYKVTRVATSTWKLTNFDANITISQAQDPSLTTPVIVSEFGGPGSDPWPSVTVTSTINGNSTTTTLSWGQSTSCTGCDLTLQPNP